MKDILRGEATADDARAEGDGKLGTMLKQLLGETIARDRRSAYCVARFRQAIRSTQSCSFLSPMKFILVPGTTDQQPLDLAA